jgi:hypothetical protein
MPLSPIADRLIPQIAYVLERNIFLSSGAIVHPLVKHYFESFDGTCYKSRPWHKKVYPNDWLIEETKQHEKGLQEKRKGCQG